MNNKPQLLHGSIVKNTTIAGIGLSETAYQADSQIPLHSHDFAYFCFVLRGNFDETYEKKTRLCRSASLIFHPPFEIHSDRFYTAARCFNLQLNDSFYERVNQVTGCGEMLAQSRGVLTSQIAARVYREFCQTDELSPLIVEGLILELLGEFLRSANKQSGSKPPVWLNLVSELLNDSFNENLSLESPKPPAFTKRIWRASLENITVAPSASIYDVCESNSPAASCFQTQIFPLAKSLWRAVSPTRAISLKLSNRQ